jgi:hypothetical protein
MADRIPDFSQYGDVYTFIDEDLFEMLGRMRQKCGSWNEVHATSGMKVRALRRLHNPRPGEPELVSMSVVDRLIQTTGVGALTDLEWYTPTELVEMGVWREPGPLFTSDTQPPARDRRAHELMMQRRRSRKYRKNPASRYRGPIHWLDEPSDS